MAHLGDRRAEAATELERIGATLGRELAAASEALDDAERLEIETKLERVARRREQLGPVNPLAEREYEQALEHVESLETQRADLETALSELQGLIRETDRKIAAAFEQTFEATERNFEELVEHLFPGGRGRLRLVDDRRGPKPVLGGAEEPQPEAPEARRERREPEPEPRGGRVRVSGRRDRGDPGGQGDPAPVAAVRGREGAGRTRLRLRRLPRPALALLHPRRGGGGARRRQHRPLPAARRALLGPGPVHRRHPPEAHHGRGARALRRLDGQGRGDQGRLSQVRGRAASSRRWRRRPKRPEYAPAHDGVGGADPERGRAAARCGSGGGARASRALRAPARAAREEPPGAARRALGEPVRPDRRGDVGAPRGGADPRRRRREGDGRRGRQAGGRGRGGRGQRPRGDPRPPGRAAGRDRLA